MTIETRIQNELTRLSAKDPEIHSTASDLNKKFDELIGKVKDHLGEISREMPEYDKHDASHSEAVLKIIEELLQEQHIEELTLLEAMILRFCCYFHDTGMILPAFCLPLLEQVEGDPKAEPKDGLKTWLRGKGNDFDSKKDLFLVPGKQDKYLDFLIRELMSYRDFRLGLERKPEDIPQEEYIQLTRHHYLRKHHGERSKTYAANLGRFFAEIIHGSEAELADIIGDICAAHSWEIEKVRKLPAKKELFLNCMELSCNVRYLAMLLRLGDLLHFGPERASKTLYLERKTMNRESDLHWLAKQGTRGYVISPTASGGVDIAYHGSFDKPNEYYFVQGHMNWVDEELNCYEAFRRQMEKASGDQRYDLGLPEKVNGDHMSARGFTPNRDFKFKLEHRNIIELLMGARLYRDEFMCLRELYQNALDACRCMRAERPGQETEIEFGLGADDDGKYLYCRDQGTGMTMDIIKNYLLRIGNSYYKSEEFRRKNAHWSDAVAPVSEFGIGLLSCYMIADRIDVITRHYTAVAGEKPIWISMTDNDDFGYQRETNWFQEDELGEHGTIVMLYLKEKFIPMVTGYIPEEPKDAAFLLDRYNLGENTGIDQEARDLLVKFERSLYHRIQQFVHIPEAGIPVWILGENRREKLFRVDECYELAEKFLVLIEHKFPLQRLIYDTRAVSRIDFHEDASALGIVPYLCRTPESETRASASILLPLPTKVQNVDMLNYVKELVVPICNTCNNIYINGMPIIDSGWDGHIWYNFCGRVRPRLTVDRGEISEIPQEVESLRETLKGQLWEIVIAQLRQHMARYPELRTQEFCAWLHRNIPGYFGLTSSKQFLWEFSKDILRDYRVLGARVYDWFHSERLVVDYSALVKADKDFSDFLYDDCAWAISVSLEKEGIVIQRGQEGEEPILPGRYLVSAKGWPERYVQYDMVNTYPDLVPERVFCLLKDLWKTGYTYMYMDKFFEDMHDSIFGDIDLSGSYACGYMPDLPVMYDALLFLQEKPESRGIHRCSHGLQFAEDGNRCYVLYVYLSPEFLTENKDYRYVPGYAEGIQKGWSILYYNYENGYVIAPGIVDRMEMLKLLPKEALEHKDGFEYYFTDGTFAF